MTGANLTINIEYEYYFDEEAYFTYIYYDSTSKQYIKYSDTISDIKTAVEKLDELLLIYPDLSLRMIPHEEFVTYLTDHFDYIIQAFNVELLQNVILIRVVWLKIID